MLIGLAGALGTQQTTFHMESLAAPDVVAHEPHHPLERIAGLRQVRRVADVPLRRGVFERYLAAGLVVGGNEALRLVAVKARLGSL